MWRTCSSCMMTAASCHLAEKTPQYSSGRSWTQQQHQLVLLAFDFTAGAILPPQCKQNQLINSCSLCVYLLTTHYCLCVPRRIEYLTQTHWIQRYGPEKGPVKIWMWVYRKIVCQMIVDLTIGPTLTMSVATGVEQLSRSSVATTTHCPALHAISRPFVVCCIPSHCITQDVPKGLTVDVVLITSPISSESLTNVTVTTNALHK